MGAIPQYMLFIIKVELTMKMPTLDANLMRVEIAKGTFIQVIL